MRSYKKEMIESQALKEISCDVCKKNFSVDKDDMQIQEFHCIDFIGGYDSIFGDTNRVQCDICQDCLNKLLGKYLRIGD